MRNFKQIIAVVVTLVMLLSVAGITASAGTAAPILSLYGESVVKVDAVNYYELKVVLTDTANKVGGIEGTISYDKDIFDYVDVVLNDSFVSAGNATAGEVVNVDESTGKIKFVGLNNASSAGEWFTLRFKTLKAGSASFALSANGADTEAYVDVTADAGASKTVADEDIITVFGASIKKINDATKQDIRFCVKIDQGALNTYLGGRTVTEYGVMMMYTKALGYGSLTVDKIGTSGVATAKITGDTVSAVGSEFFANLNGMQANALGVKVSARAYAKLSDGSVLYSKNFAADKKIVNGYSSRSVIDVARLAAKAAIDADNGSIDAGRKTEMQGILALTSIKDENRTKLLSFINDYCKEAVK